MACVRDINKKFKNKNVLFVSHGDPLRFLYGGLKGFSNEQFWSMEYNPANAHVTELDAPTLPFNNEGRLDLHRPFIDRIVLRDPKTKKELHRVKEVVDGWFDSGSMPYAQAHFPFAQAQGGKVTPATLKKIDFPADFIAEGIDQTRGWFYTLLAVATALDLPTPYKNVICLGLIHDKNGLKMSKSRGNIVNPMELMQKHGADVMRWYFYTVNDPGESKNFDEADFSKLTRRFILILYNSLLFWNSYGRGAERHTVAPSENVLDRWIIAQTNTLISSVTRSLDAYEVGKAAIAIEQFTDDLSRWYIRRSRDRFQNSARGTALSEGDYNAAATTLHEVLLTLSKLTAPFMPFFSEAMYKTLDGKLDSVHLENWPVADATKVDIDLVRNMALVRTIAAQALALRAEAKIKVRQPLQKITLKDTTLQGSGELLKILFDEVNVKEVAFNEQLAVEGGIALDTTITQQLREEGVVRELSRAVQGLRADAKYQMSDEIVLILAGNEQFSDLVQRHSIQLKKAVNAKTIELTKSEKADAQLETKVDEQPVWIGVRKI